MSKPDKPKSFKPVNCRVPPEIHEKMQEVTKLTQQSSAQLVGTALEAYVRWLTGEEFVNDRMKVDRFAVGLKEKRA